MFSQKHLNSNTLFVFLSSSSCSTTTVLIKIFETRCNLLQFKTPYLVFFTALQHIFAAKYSPYLNIWNMLQMCFKSIITLLFFHLKVMQHTCSYCWSCTDSVLGFCTSIVLQFHKGYNWHIKHFLCTYE